MNVDIYFGYFKENKSVYGGYNNGQASHSYFDISSHKCLHFDVPMIL